jgi:glutaminyl-tRNA synthetase
MQRGGEKGTSPRYRCEHAEQSVEENLTKFRDMRDGKYRPREAFLRMKQDVCYRTCRFAPRRLTDLDHIW